MKTRMISLLTAFVMLVSLCVAPAALAVTVDPANIPSLTLTVSDVTVSNLAESWQLVVASYNARGDVVKSATVALSAGADYTSTLSALGIVTDRTDGAVKVKAFVWKDFTDIQAAVDSKEVEIPAPVTPGPGSSGTTYYTLKLIDGEKETVKSYTRNSTVDLEVLAGEKEGFEIEGFYLDAEFTEKTESPYRIAKDIVIYVKWQEVKDTPDSPFRTDEHFAYIIGYPSENGSKEVRPENNISREEIATIFYRLVKDEVRQQYYTTSNNFSDVEDSRWSNEYISTIAKGGFILGDTEGTFRPEDYITRAEFVTIASRFFDADGEDFIVDDKFTDISGHWGENFINYAVNAGWIDGDGDGSFRPDDYITRAETMKIINAILNRHVDKDGLIDGYIVWDDNAENAWYYYEVIEATNAHEYGRVQNSNLENWTQIIR